MRSTSMSPLTRRAWVPWPRGSSAETDFDHAVGFDAGTAQAVGQAAPADEVGTVLLVVGGSARVHFFEEVAHGSVAHVVQERGGLQGPGVVRA
jgi:hypothetical protein